MAKLNRKSAAVHNLCTIWHRTPWNTGHQQGAKPLTGQQDPIPALTYEPGGRRFESCRAHQINNLQPRDSVPKPVVFNFLAAMLRTRLCRNGTLQRRAEF